MAGKDLDFQQTVKEKFGLSDIKISDDKLKELNADLKEFGLSVEQREDGAFKPRLQTPPSELERLFPGVAIPGSYIPDEAGALFLNVADQARREKDEKEQIKLKTELIKDIVSYLLLDKYQPEEIEKAMEIVQTSVEDIIVKIEGEGELQKGKLIQEIIIYLLPILAAALLLIRSDKWREADLKEPQTAKKAE